MSTSSTYYGSTSHGLKDVISINPKQGDVLVYQEALKAYKNKHTDELASGANLGAGEPIYAGEITNEFQFKTLTASGQATLTSTAQEVNIGVTMPPDTVYSAANVNTGGGFGVYDSQEESELRFRGINSGSSKAIVTYDIGEKEINVDVNEANIPINNLSGAPNSSVVGVSDSQTLTNKTINGNDNIITNLADSAIKPSAQINANKIADGTVQNTQYQYINTLTSNAQNQINALSSQQTDHANLTIAHGTLSNIVGKDDTVELTNKTINTASNFLHFDASDIETGILPVDRGGTNNNFHTDSDGIVRYRYVAGYEDIDKEFSPLAWFKYGDLAGQGASITWPSSTGTGSIYYKGSGLRTDATMGGKQTVNLEPSAPNDTTEMLTLDLDGFYGPDLTVAFVTSSWNLLTNYSRVFCILNNPAVADQNQAGGSSLIHSNGNGSKDLSTAYDYAGGLPGSGDVTWSGAPINYTFVDAQPCLVVFRYNSTSDEFKISINKATDSLVNSILYPNFDNLSVRYLKFGNGTANSDASAMKLSDVIVWNRSLSDSETSSLSGILLSEFGRRAPITEINKMVSIKCIYNATTTPTVDDDADDGFEVGSRWINISADYEYLCVDSTVGNAVWRRTTLPNAVLLDAPQTMTNKTIDCDNNTITNIDNNEIRAGAGIDATKIGDGSVDNTEFQYLHTLTGNIQDQINTKLNTSQVSAFMLTVIDDADANTVRTDLGLGTASTQNVDDFATGAEGDLATTALQPADNISELVNDVGYVTNITAPVTSVNTYTGAVVLTKSDVGLDQVDNTSDVNKPLSTATTNALALKLDASAVSAYGSTLIDDINATTARATLGLDQIDNTSDLDKPISTATQNALNLKLDASGVSAFGATLIDDADAPTARTTLGLGTASTNNTGDFATSAQGLLADSSIQPGDNISTLTNDSNFIDSAGAPVQSVNTYTGAVVLVKADVGLGNVDNTSDANKPISTATQTALDLKANLAGATFTGDVIVDEGTGSTIKLETTDANNAGIHIEGPSGSMGYLDTTNGFGNDSLQVYSALLWARAINGGTGNIKADGTLTVDGTLTANGTILMPNLGDYTNDINAAAGGVPVGGVYRNGSDLHIRVS